MLFFCIRFECKCASNSVTVDMRYSTFGRMSNAHSTLKQNTKEYQKTSHAKYDPNQVTIVKVISMTDGQMPVITINVINLHIC